MQTDAFAKLNLALAVTGKRADGYHLLDTIFCQINLFDTLTLESAEGDGLSFSCSDERLLDDDNLVLRAARLFSQKAGVSLNLRLHLHKRIPVRAGLGGGSADAAAALRMLDDLYPDLSSADLFDMALSLGADVPFALIGGVQRAQGIGEILAPMDVRRVLHFVIVKPEMGLSTPRSVPIVRYDAQKQAHQYG